MLDSEGMPVANTDLPMPPMKPPKDKQWGTDNCPQCHDKLKKEWEKEHAEELKQIDTLEKQGHSPHCACRLVWGDGECECRVKEEL